MQSRPMSPEQALPRLTALLDAGLSCRLVVTGNSMLPFLRHKRDAVILSPLSGPAHRGDILFYLRGNAVPILHRVCAVRPDGWLLMCGDAQVGLEPVSPDRVLARVTQIDKNGTLSDPTTPLSRLKAELWIMLRPVRPYILAVLRRLGKLHEGDIYGEYH